jgi:hypothetical protein
MEPFFEVPQAGRSSAMPLFVGPTEPWNAALLVVAQDGCAWGKSYDFLSACQYRCCAVSQG